MHNPINVYLDYGRTYFPDDIDRLTGLAGKPKVFRFAYKITNDNVWALGACRRHTRDECKDEVRKLFALQGYTANILPSLEGVR